MGKFIGKTILIAGIWFAGSTLCAGECKNCGVDTKNVSVYRCKKCRNFFCDKCRDGDCKKEDRNPVTKELEAWRDSVKSITGITVICPECGNKDKLAFHRFTEGKIKLIKE